MRRNRGPTVTVRRQGPGLIQTAARTAVIAGTATAVSKGVSGAMDSSAQQKAAAQQQAAAARQAEFDAAVQQAAAEQLAAQQAAAEQLAAQQAAAMPAPATSSADRIAKLQQLAELKNQGILTDEEFAAEKARILAS